MAVWLTDAPDQSKEYLPKISQYFKGAALTVFGSTDGPNGWGINSDARVTTVVACNDKVVKAVGYLSLNETDAAEAIEILKTATPKTDDLVRKPASQPSTTQSPTW